MANKNHALDAQIDRAALKEFLDNGYEKASLRKIAAAAGVTIGAIYTRYPTKDSLFCALVQPLLLRIDSTFQTLRGEYRSSAEEHSPREFVTAMEKESELILHLLFDDYDRAVLLLCRSAGSSLEHFFDAVVERKVEETIAFFRSTGVRGPDEAVLKVLLTGQFHMYFQIISEGYQLTAAREMMHAVMAYHTGGWLALLGLDSSNHNHSEV